MASSPPSRLTRVEMVTMRPIPAVSARATMRVEIVGKIRKVEVAVAVDEHGLQTAQSAFGST